MLKAYFDETGLHGGSKVFALCGYVAPESEWEPPFDVKWRELLKKPCQHPVDFPNAAEICRPLEYLHAKEMEGMGEKRFRSIGQRNRDYLRDQSISIVINSGIVGIASAVIIADYDALDGKVKEEIGDPYILCFQHVITEVCKAATIFVGEDSSENIVYIFEHQPHWQTQTNEMWVKSVEKGYKQKYRMGTLTFGDKKDFMPLQAADRNAFETYQHFAEPRVDRPAWNALQRWPQHRGKYFNGTGFVSLIEQLKLARRL